MDQSMDSDRVIALIDMDCFYAQVEQKDRPESIGKPLIAVQNNNSRMGMILSANYDARARGIKTGMRVQEAMIKCPELILAQAPCQRGKTDLTKYRNASKQVFSVLLEFGSVHEITVEIASIDEAYLDLTTAVRNVMDSRIVDNSVVTVEDLPTSHVVTNDEEEPDSLAKWLRIIIDERRICDLKLALGASLVEQVRSRILKETGYHCSAGIGENKMLAKLVCKLHKPKRQTIIPRDAVAHLFITTPIEDVRNLGGKLGASVCERFGIGTMAQLASVSLDSLKESYKPKTALWLHQLSNGIDTEEVVLRQLVKSIGCSKNFPGKQALRTKAEVENWMKILCEEMEERLRRDQAANHRTARNMCVSIRLEGSHRNTSRHCPLPSYDSVHIARVATRIISEFNEAEKDSEKWTTPLTNLSISAGRFEDSVDIPDSSITTFFKPAARTSYTTDSKEVPEESVSTDIDVSIAPNQEERPDSPVAIDVFITDDITNTSKPSRDAVNVPWGDSSSSCCSTTVIGPTNFKNVDLSSDTNSRSNDGRDPDFFAATREGALKRRLLAEETAAAFRANDETRLEAAKDSFFLKRLREIRQRQERERQEEDKEEEAKRVEEDEKRRRFQERAAAVLASPKKKLLPRPSVINESNFVDAEPWLPTDQTSVDDETWRDLPPEIQWELRQHFRRSGTEEVQILPPAASPSRKSKRTGKVPGASSSKKKVGTRPRKEGSKGNEANGIRKLSDYFQPS